jgi:competence protein ComEA
MLKRSLFFAAAFAAACFVPFAHALDIDVNTADEAALRAIKGIGPTRAKAIVDERAAGGPFKDADDLGRRVKGLGGQAVDRLQAQGLTVGDIGGAAPIPPTQSPLARKATSPYPDRFGHRYRIPAAWA